MSAHQSTCSFLESCPLRARLDRCSLIWTTGMHIDEAQSTTDALQQLVSVTWHRLFPSRWYIKVLGQVTRDLELFRPDEIRD